MNENEWLAEQFEENRERLRGVAYRMLGSLSEADDAVQESWLRLSRSDTTDIRNLGGWLTTVVARVCLDMLRSRKMRSEEPLDAGASAKRAGGDAEREAVLADSVGLALLVVLETLAPDERLAFVLHDLFGMSFEEIARIVDKTPAAARQLASRARRRVQGRAAVGDADLRSQRKTVDAFIAALRDGDFEGLVSVLHPDVVVRVDHAAAAAGRAVELRGARDWARNAVAFGKAFGAGEWSRPALINGKVGIVFAPRGRLSRVLMFSFDGDRIATVDIVADPVRLRELELGVVS